MRQISKHVYLLIASFLMVSTFGLYSTASASTPLVTLGKDVVGWLRGDTCIPIDNNKQSCKFIKYYQCSSTTAIPPSLKSNPTTLPKPKILNHTSFRSNKDITGVHNSKAFKGGAVVTTKCDAVWGAHIKIVKHNTPPTPPKPTPPPDVISYKQPAVSKTATAKAKAAAASCAKLSPKLKDLGNWMADSWTTLNATRKSDDAKLLNAWVAKDNATLATRTREDAALQTNIATLLDKAGDDTTKQAAVNQFNTDMTAAYTAIRNQLDMAKAGVDITSDRTTLGQAQGDSYRAQLKLAIADRQAAIDTAITQLDGEYINEIATAIKTCSTNKNASSTLKSSTKASKEKYQAAIKKAWADYQIDVRGLQKDYQDKTSASIDEFKINTQTALDTLLGTDPTDPTKTD